MLPSSLSSSASESGSSLASSVGFRNSAAVALTCVTRDVSAISYKRRDPAGVSYTWKGFDLEGSGTSVFRVARRISAANAKPLLDITILGLVRYQ